MSEESGTLNSEEELLEVEIIDEPKAGDEEETVEETTPIVIEETKPKPKKKKKKYKRPKVRWIVYRNRRSEQLWVFCNYCDPNQQTPLHLCLPCDGYICDSCKGVIRQADARRIAR